jgi:hypothetical protein
MSGDDIANGNNSIDFGSSGIWISILSGLKGGAYLLEMLPVRYLSSEAKV